MRRIEFLVPFLPGVTCHACLSQGSAVQELSGLSDADGAQRRLLGAVQGLCPLLAAHGPLVPHLLAHLRTDQECLWHLSILGQC